MSHETVLSQKPMRRRIRRQSRRFSFTFYQAIYGPMALLKAIYRQMVLLSLMFLSGAAIFIYYAKLPFVNALLASVSTITTIGFYVPNGGNFLALNQTEAVLLIIMIIISVGAVASTVQSMVSTLINGNLAKSEAGKQMIKRLKRHVIVFGYSNIGRYVTDKLDELGFDYVTITKDPLIYDQLLAKDKFAVLEYETQPIVALRSAGVDKATMVIVAHEKDADNMLVILSAKKMRPDIRIVSVVHDQALSETAKNAGADMVIPASVTVGHLLALSAVTKDLVGVVFSEKIGTKEIAEFSIFKSSKLIGKDLREVSKYAAVVGVVRDEKVLTNIFDPDFRLKEDDTLIVLGQTDQLHDVEKQAKAL